MPGVDQPVEYLDEPRNVGHMQADSRFIQDIQRMRRLLPAPGNIVAYLGELGDELDTLRFATGQRRRWLPQRQIAQPDILHQLQRVSDLRDRAEKFDGLIHFHGQHLADIAATPRHRQRLGIEALPVTHVARHFHIGQEAHADGADPLAFARRATSVARVERKARRRVPACARFERLGKQFSDCIPHPDVRRRARAWRLADRRLIHL